MFSIQILLHFSQIVPRVCTSELFIEKIRERGREGGRERGREGDREGGKEVGKEEGSVRAILSHRLTPNKAMNSVHQAICREKQNIAKQNWGTDVYLVPKILKHSYLELKILGQTYLEQNNTRTQLFRAK